MFKLRSFILAIAFLVMTVILTAPTSAQSSSFKWDAGGEDEKVKSLFEVFFNSFNLTEDFEASYTPRRESLKIHSFGTYEEYRGSVTSYHFGSPTDAMFEYYSSYEADLLIEKLDPEIDTNNFDLGGEYDPRNDYENRVVKNGVELLFDHEFYKPSEPRSPFGEKAVSFMESGFVYCSPYKIKVSIWAHLFRDFATDENQLKTREWIFTNFTEAVNATGICEGTSSTSSSDRPVNFDTKNPVSARLLSVSPSDGEIEISESGGAYRSISPGEAIPMDSTLSTGFETEAVIELTDVNGNVARLYVKEMSAFTLMFLEGEGSDALYKTQVTLNAGGIHVKERASAPILSTFQIVTPTSTVGVRGTEFLVEIDPTTLITSVEVYEGEVVVTGDIEGEEVLTAGMRTSVSEFGSVSDPETFDVDPGDMIVDEILDTDDSPFWVDLIIYGFCFGLFILFLVLSIVFFKKKKKVLGIVLLILSLLILCGSLASVLVSSIANRAPQHFNDTPEELQIPDDQIAPEDEVEPVQDDLNDSSPTTPPDKVSDEPEDIGFFDGRMSFSYDPEFADRIRSQFEESDKTTYFCMETTDPTADQGVCEGGEALLFVIYEITEEDWNNMVDLGMEGNDVVLGQFPEGDQNLFILSRPSGDVPNDFPGDDFFTVVAETFFPKIE